MTLRLILDESLPKRAAEVLRDQAIEAWQVNEINLCSASDQDILAEADQRDAVVVCYDADFHRYLALSGATSPSVIRIRIEALTPQALAELIVETTKSAEPMLRSGAVLSVNEDSVRGRPLPLTH